MAKKKVFSIGRSLSEGLEQTIVAAQNYSSELRIDIIPITKIELDPENPRMLTISKKDIIEGLDKNDLQYEKKLNDLTSLETLASSIKDQGIINPILVYEKNGIYRLIAGERRTLASIIAKKSDIQAKILDSKPDELKIRVLQWVENIERTDLTLIERIDNLEKLVSAYARQSNQEPHKVRITDISKLLGCTKSHAISLRAVLNADPEIKNLISENKIRNLEKAALLTSIQSPNLKKKAILACINGATLKNLKLFLEQDNANSIRPITQNKFSINLGSTSNFKVTQAILRSIITHENLLDFKNEFESLNEYSSKDLSRFFRKIIKKLEEIHDNNE